MMMMTGRRTDKMHDQTMEDSFPASDPPASTGITGPRVGEGDRPTRDRKSRTTGSSPRPKGTPTHERHASETACQGEDEKRPTESGSGVRRRN